MEDFAAFIQTLSKELAALRKRQNYGTVSAVIRRRPYFERKSLLEVTQQTDQQMSLG